MSLVPRIGIAVGVFAVVSALAALFGATNFGTALAFGQIAFAAAVAFLIIRT
jgi:hypothetical protein